MSLLLVALLSVGVASGALGLHDLQMSLERREQERHAND
jgi:hypothetical protein